MAIPPIIFWFKMSIMAVLLLFLPLMALAHHFLRRHRRLSEVRRIFSILDIDCDYRQAFDDDKPGLHLLAAVAYCLLVSSAGMLLVFMPGEIGLTEFLKSCQAASWRFPAGDSRLITAMAFLGAYLWGIQHVFRRYSLNDLIPGVYYNLSMRMILAAVIALVIYNAYEALAGGGGNGGNGGVLQKTWPALALVIGMFPQRGLHWLMDKIPIFSPKSEPSVENASLDMIEGIEVHDRMRLEELGIDTCYDLATADFVPLMLKSPYSARQLVDWILQAKLCIYFGPAVKDLRQHSIRTITDLEDMQDAETLAAETAVTLSALQRAQKSVKKDNEIKRLRKTAEILGKFWGSSTASKGRECPVPGKAPSTVPEKD